MGSSAAITAKRVAISLASLGTLFAAGIVVMALPKGEEHRDSALFFLLLFVLGPWLILDVVLVTLRWMRGVAVGAALMLAFELLLFFGIFLNPQSSTDAVAYVVKPGVQLLLLLPIGLLVGWAMDRRSNQQR